MADFTFLFNRKGAIYPLDLASVTSSSSSSSSSLPPFSSPLESQHLSPKTLASNEWPLNNVYDSTLVHLCSKVIVSNQSLVDKATDTVPNELFIPLFKAALYPVRDYAIDVRESIFLF